MKRASVPPGDVSPAAEIRCGGPAAPRQTSVSDAPDRTAGFTIMELLVVMTVIAVLVALLLPAVQAAREAARRTECRNHLRQIAVAAQNFHSRHNHLPANGWGFGWVGEPDRGAGKAQPGGWIYQLLPDLEQANIRAIGAGLPEGPRRAALAQLCRTPLPLFKCPSRSSEQLGPPSTRWSYRNADPPAEVARTDYAVNEGDVITGTPIGPETLAEGDDPRYAWHDVSVATGVSWLRGGARLSEITDGTSNTYFAGEKHVSYNSYVTPTDRGYDQALYSGVDLDTTRWTMDPPLRDQPAPETRRFGSAHAQACHMAYCDGSVRAVSYAIADEVHTALGNRSDGRVLSEY